MISFDELLHSAYSSPYNTWTYVKIRTSKRPFKKHKKLGLHILQRKRSCRIEE